MFVNTVKKLGIQFVTKAHINIDRIQELAQYTYIY